ncbi:uncharacterized protein [Ptychodera flava]
MSIGIGDADCLGDFKTNASHTTDCTAVLDLFTGLPVKDPVCSVSSRTRPDGSLYKISRTCSPAVSCYSGCGVNYADEHELCGSCCEEDLCNTDNGSGRLNESRSSLPKELAAAFGVVYFLYMYMVA